MPRQRSHYDPVPPWWYPSPDPPGNPEPAEPNPGEDTSPATGCTTDLVAPPSDAAPPIDAASDQHLTGIERTELLAGSPAAAAPAPSALPAGAATPPRADIGLPDNTDNPVHSDREESWTANPAVAQLAVRWAIDFCSWDEDNPSRRDVALRRYLHQPASVRGWSGYGRQRATFAVAGSVWIDEVDPDVAWVDVETLVTPYEPRPVRAINDPSGKWSGEPSLSRPSSAPAPETSGWRPLDSAWMQVIAAVRRLPAGGLVIDPEIDPAALDELDAPEDGTDLTITDQAL